MSALQSFGILSILLCGILFLAGYLYCQAKANRFRMDLVAARERVDIVETERSKIEADRMSLWVDITDLKRKLSDAEKKRTDNENREGGFGKKVADLEAALRASEARGIEIARKLVTVNTALDERSSLLIEIENSCLEARSMLQKTSKRLLDTERALEQERSKNHETVSMIELDVTKAKLTETVRKLEETKTELDETKATFDETKANLDRTEAQLGETKAALDETKAKLDETKTDLDGAKARLAVLTKSEIELSLVKDALQKTEEELREKTALAEELLLSRDRLGADLEARKSDMEIQGMEIQDLKLRLQTAQSKLGEIDRVVEENRELRIQNTNLEEHRENTPELERIKVEYKQLKLDAEILGERTKKLESAEIEIIELRSRVEELSLIASEVDALRHSERRLQARLFAGSDTPTLVRRAISDPGEITTAHALEDGLSVLLNEKHAKSAVLADGNGFLVASAGDQAVTEGLAAFTSLVGEMATRARSFLPLGSLAGLKLFDANNLGISCRFFDSDGSTYGLATVGRNDSEHDEAEEQTITMIQSFAGQSRISGEHEAVAHVMNG